jgi:hypothetical protein
MARKLEITTRQADITGAPASLQLGGVTLYGATTSALRAAVESIGEAICQSSAAHPTLTKVTLASEVKKVVGLIIEKRVFGSILGQQLRLGAVDCVPCAAISGKVFRIYLHESRADEFISYLGVAEDQLRQAGVMEVRQLEARLFGRRKWGTWSSTLHVLARLVQKGKARYRDSSTFLWQSGVEHAIHED